MATRIPAGMIPRIKAILLQPKAEWPVIDAEPMPTARIFTGWVVPLAAIGPVAGLIGGQLFGYGAFGFSYRPGLGFSLSMAFFAYLSALFGTWLTAKIIDLLAPTFGATPNANAAMKVAAFGFTASYLTGVFQLIPSLGFLGLLALYSLYLVYLGLPLLMKAPAEKALGYTIAVCVAAIVVMAVLVTVTSTITSRLAAPSFVSASGGEVTVPGMGTIDTTKLEEASKKIEAQAKAAEAGTLTVTAPDALAGLLPTSVGGWSRTAIESSSAAAGGMGGSRAEGRYAQGEQSATLSVTDMAALGALAAMGSAMNMQQSRETADGYEKVGKVDGRMTTEEWNRADSRGKFGVVIGDRFMVEASGRAPDIEALKALVASVDAGRLEALAR